MIGELDYITVKGFRSIKCIERLALRPINLLIGSNGSGKSNFVEVFALLQALRQGRLLEYTEKRGGADNILHFGSKQTPSIELEISFRNGVNGYSVKLSATDDDRFRIHDEKAWFWNKEKYPAPYTVSLHGTDLEAGIGYSQAPGIQDWVRERLDRWRIYHFHDTGDSSPLKKTADIDDNCFLRPDGSNLAAYLFLLRQKHTDAYQLIRKAVQRVAPFFDDFQLVPQRLNESKIKLAWNHIGSDRYFSASSLSDGTLRFICLATLFLQPSRYRSSVFLVDEPELGLHPYAITMLSNMIKSTASETQVIVSTQSSLLLDHFQPEDVLVADRVEGTTTLRRLDSSGHLTDWLKDYSLGQLWEKNEIGGRPNRDQAIRLGGR